jgi:hypothetical protein
MTGNIKLMISKILITICFIGCMNKADNDVANIIINTQNYGWYFIEIKPDSLVTDHIETQIKIDSIMQLNEIAVSDYNKLVFNIFDTSGMDISSRMKLSGILFNYDKRIFFKFYYPTELELKTIKKWLPTDSAYQGILNKSAEQLKKMLAKK